MVEPFTGDIEDMARAGTLRQLNELRSALLDWFDARDRWGKDSNEAYELEHVTRAALTGESEVDRLRFELAWACDTIERLAGESLTKLNARGRDHLERASELALANNLTPYEQSVIDRALDKIERGALSHEPHLTAASSGGGGDYVVECSCGEWGELVPSTSDVPDAKEEALRQHAVHATTCIGPQA